MCIYVRYNRKHVMLTYEYEKLKYRRFIGALCVRYTCSLIYKYLISKIAYL